jgi:glyoxylase-like metal-dependent hydrolase (beta-lactamase superfamily II)
MIKMHALNTAEIDVKRSYVDAKGTNRLVRLTSVLLDGTWTRIPVFVWVIEHPEGVIVIDTGETAQVNHPDYFPVLQRPYWHSQYRFHVTPEMEAGAQLRQIGIPPQEVRWVVMTHMHFDHSDALYHFPKAEFIVSRREHEDVYEYRSAHFAFPSKFPDWFNPTVIDYRPERVGTFTSSYPLTQAGDVHIVPTPGHTSGHQSVVLLEEGMVFFFGGDSSFDQDSLLTQRLDAPAVNAQQVFETRQHILDYARQTPLVYLTTHDPETATRLGQHTPIFIHETPLRTDVVEVR